jgi:hypothetical protein
MGGSVLAQAPGTPTPAAPTPPVPPTPSSTLATPAPPAAPIPSLAAVLTRAGEYALAYESRFSLLVAEEDYYQRADRPPQAGNANQARTSNPSGSFDIGGRRARRLRSDYLLVKSDEGGWLPFRDVFEVDGRKVRDREDRMVKLLLSPSPSALDRARRLMDESTRYNLGRVVRTINIPTLAVLLVQPNLRARFVFTRDGETMVAGRSAWALAFDERVRPTLVRTTTGADLPMSGRLWIDPATGTVLKTEMSVADSNVIATVAVEFREDTSLDLWVPAEMTEYYKATSSSDEIRCTATYKNYRKFSVSTDEEIEKPPTKKPPG